MAAITNKRSIMTLYSGPSDLLSHRVRIVLAEKGVPYDLINVDVPSKFTSLVELNPYGTIPTLVDRDLVLYEANIITEYLDERFPHPPLMPVYPVARAKVRLIIYRFDREWLPVIRKIETSSGQELISAKETLHGYITQLLPIFNSSPFFTGEEFSLVDCCLAPVLWRLAHWDIQFPAADMKIINKYISRIFQRDSFQASLTESEQEMVRLSTVA